MKRIYIVCIYLLITISAFGQSYSSSFYSEDAICRYLESNISKLDPIEGKYDVQVYMRTTSPFQQDYDYPLVYYVIKQPYTNKFTIYVGNAFGESFRKSPNVKIESIGTSNVYRLYWQNSSNRGILENGFKFTTDIELSSTDAKHFSGNPNFGFRIALKYDFVKSYPTSAMYAEAARKEEEKRRAEEKRRIEEEAKEAEWTGTGFALKDGYIVTNYHVIEDATEITVKGIMGDFSKQMKAEVVTSDINSDLAILKINDSMFTGFGAIPYRIRTEVADVAEEVFVLGYPLTTTMGDEIKYTTGVISSKTGFQGDISLYQISAPVQPGSSGGPLFDSKGALIGIVNAKHQGAENVGYAIKASYMRNLIESYTSTSIIPTSSSIASMSRPDKIKAIKKFVFLIECSKKRASSSTSYGGVSSSVTTMNTNKQMTISQKYLSIKVGETATLSCNNYGASLSWSSDNSSVASVTNNGVVKGIKPGTTYIWAKGDDVKLCQVTVNGASYSGSSQSTNSTNSITIHSKEATVKVGQRIKADISDGKITKWEIPEYLSSYVSSTGDELIINKYKSGVISIWGYIDSSPKLFKLNITY